MGFQRMGAAWTNRLGEGRDQFGHLSPATWTANAFRGSGGDAHIGGVFVRVKMHCRNNEKLWKCFNMLQGSGEYFAG